jgi:geranylgeranyl pyrophosphate synthase
MLAMEEAPIAAKLKKLIAPGRELSASEGLEVVDLVRASRGPHQALERARELSSEARQHLQALGAGDARDALEALTTYVVSRKL